VAARIVEAIGLLLEQPSLGRPGRMPDTRELVVSGTPYVVAYTVVGRQTVKILAVLHGKQRWPESL
jgi:toxin ParE1/3/4